MRIIARPTLQRYADSRARHREHTGLKKAVDAWFDEVHQASWSNTAEVKQHYAIASIVTAERIVFNLKGNDYRLVVAVDFRRGIVFVKWIGTHQDDDRINAAEVEHDD